jgi:ribosome maturation factor RimP
MAFLLNDIVHADGQIAHFFWFVRRLLQDITAFLYTTRRRTAEVWPVLVLQLEPLAKKVADLLEPHIERLGFELVNVEFHQGTRRNSLLRLLVDKPGGGIMLSDLERLSPVLSDLLDVYDPVDGRYTLEVSSPGINRPLAKLKDFEAYRGQRVRIRTFRPREGRKNFEGVLLEVHPDGIDLEDELSRQRQAFAFNEIQGANYEHKFD